MTSGNRLVVGVCLFGTFLCGALFSSRSNGQGQAEPSNVKWEYKVVGDDGGEFKFNELGKEGWELVAVASASRGGAGAATFTPPAYYFKRRR